jgi:dTDP-4-dehydrorhamnose reductase
MTILICGASGLVGRHLCKLFEEKNINYIGTYNSNKIGNANKLIKIDFLSNNDIEKTLQIYNITSCIFLIVQRNTDICENNWEEIKKINIDMVNNTSFICNKFNVKFIHLSTDYVFDGSKQPNYPEDLNNPLQNYGISKLLSELKVKKNCKKYCIIRTPVLYSELSDLYDNAITLISKNIIDLRKIAKKEDNFCIRRPLYIDDLCLFIVYSIEQNLQGVYHFYNPYNKFTKYEISKKIAKYLNINDEHITPNNDFPEGIAARPYDTMLMDDKFNINNFIFTDFDLTIKKCFEKFKHPIMTNQNKEDFFILLDLDGTIIESNKAHYISYKNVFKNKNLEFITFEEWDNIISKNNFDNYLKNIFSIEEIQNIKNDKLIYFEKQNIDFIKNCDLFLNFIIENNINCCIVTNTNKKTAEIIKRKLPLLKNIKNWIVREDYNNPKPFSECYELAIHKYYNNEKYIIGIEDTYAGVSSLKSVTDIIYLFDNNTNTDKFNYYIFNDYNYFTNNLTRDLNEKNVFLV